MSITKVETYKNCFEFIENIPFFNQDKSIYRGQENEYDYTGNKTNEWGIVSSFSRFYKGEVSFGTFISQHIQQDLFPYFFSDYKYDKIDDLVKASQIEKIYFLQHYGIPTCFIDFTRNPLIALYFAVAGIKFPSVKKFSNGKSTSFPEELYFTIWQIRCDLLTKYFKIKEVTDTNLFMSLEEYSLDFSGFEEFKIGIDLDPISRNTTIDNYNLEKQEGCFLFFDNSRKGLLDTDFESLLGNIKEDNKLKLSSVPIITKHQVPYYSLMRLLRDRKEQESVFQYLKNKGISGATLFNDIQGLKYDLQHILLS